MSMMIQIMVCLQRRLRAVFVFGVVSLGLYFAAIQHSSFYAGEEREGHTKAQIPQLGHKQSDTVSLYLQGASHHQHVSNSIGKGPNLKELLDKPNSPLAQVGTYLTANMKLASHSSQIVADQTKIEKETGLKGTAPVQVVRNESAPKNLPSQNIKFANYPRSMPRRYHHDRKGLERYKQYLKEVEDPLPEQKQAVIILTNHRSGSSFFGELFNQHPDVFYIFEPLFPLSNSSRCELHVPQKIEALKDLVKCSLPNWEQVYKGIPVKEQIKENANIGGCLNKGICFRKSTKELCEDRHCPRTYSSSVKNCASDCGDINRLLADNDCRRKSMVALKIIRLCDITDIEKIISTISTDIKILHLLRDPRGIANSRQLVMKGINIKDSILGTCNRQAHNLMTGAVNPPERLKGRYMAVRYEDVALYPYAMAKSVYDFVGLSFPEEMKHWIKSNTKTEIPPDDFFSPETSGSVIHRQKRKALPSHGKVKEILKRSVQNRKYKNPYGTTRDSAKIVQKWATRLPYTTVKMIETVCSKVMAMAGYIKTADPDQYKYNRTIKYFTDDIPVLNS